MAARKATIRKYGNRRLYDSTNSRYVNLEDLAGMVRSGVEIQVVDASTGEDLTRVVLTQIIVEDAKDDDSALPLDLLHQLVATSGKVYRQAYQNFQAGLRDPARAAANPIDFLQGMFGQPAPPPPESSDMDELRRRVEELEKRVAGRRRKRSGK
jgi:polyhydroxyalkanoate synthesis repressor PhaR